MTDNGSISNNNIKNRPVCDRVIANKTAVFRNRKPKLLLVRYVLSLSESQRQSTLQRKPVYIWRADDVQLIYSNNQSEVYRTLCESDGKEVTDDIKFERKFERTVDPEFVKLINDNRPDTAPEDTPMAYVTKVHLRRGDVHADFNARGAEAHFARIMSGAVNK